jgi:hypothetical protein
VVSYRRSGGGIAPATFVETCLKKHVVRSFERAGPFGPSWRKAFTLLGRSHPSPSKPPQLRHSEGCKILLLAEFPFCSKKIG